MVVTRNECTDTRRTRLQSFVVLCALFAVFIRFLTSLTYSFSHRLGALVEKYPILILTFLSVSVIAIFHQESVTDN